MSRTMYYGGNIYTMEDSSPCVEAVVTEDTKILFAGDRSEAEKLAGAKTERYDLQGKTMFPAFIDAHSHITNVAMSFLQVSLYGTVSVEEIQERILAFIQKEELPEGTWIQASGYDHNQFADKQHPDRFALDAISKKYPIVLIHQSGHMGVMNSLALEMLHINNKTKAPEGGMIGKKDGELTGYLEENAYIQALKKIPLQVDKRIEDAFVKAQNLYASYGITTVQDGMMEDLLAPLFRRLCEKRKFFLDVVGYVDMYSCTRLFLMLRLHIKRYHTHFKIGGYKTFLDGSPQGRTAWMREPYLPNEGEEKAQETYCGYPILSDEKLEEQIVRAMEDRMQILAHCNGDAAAEQYVTVYQKVMKRRKEEGKEVPRLRPVMIHAQFLGKDQLKKVKACGMIPSFFVAHVYHWGDIHKRNMGEERASAISPTASAQKEGIRFTFHQDAPVILPNMLETIWCAVNRRTKAGELLGEEEQISVQEAWKAVTINAAYQYREERQKGSIARGKIADFVILSQNPFEIAKEKIRDIQVIETIREGKTIYKNAESAK